VPALAGILPMFSGCAGPFSMLDPAGPAAATAAWLWWGMFTAFTLVLVAVCGLWLYAMFRTPPSRDEAQTRRMERRWLIGGGLVLPMVSIVLLLSFGIPAGHSMLPLAPDEGDAFEVRVTAHQWHWEVRYPDRDVTLLNEVHIPAGRPVDVHLSSADVIHSFWVPRLGGKLDALPGRTQVLRLQADEPGLYRGQCAEFCGTGHTHMHFSVIAHSAEDFAAWREEATAHD